VDIRVLGSSGSRVPGQQTSCLLVNERFAIDAGGVTGTLTVEEQVQIDHVFLTHAHLDHVFDLAFLADNVMTLRNSTLRIWAPEPVLEVLQAHLFNDQIWPDMSKLQVKGFPVLTFCPLAAGETVRIEDIEVTWATTSHTVFSAGYLLTQENVSVLFTGDTCSTEAIWEMANRCSGLAAVFVETSFPDSLTGLARETGHLSPFLLQQELQKLDKPELPVKIFHMKSQYLEEIRRDLKQCCPQCEILNGNEQLRF